MNIKRIPALVLALVLIFSMTACSSTSASAAASTEPEIAETTAAPVNEEPAEDTHDHGEEPVSAYMEMLTRETDPTMLELYAANGLETVLNEHKCITVTMTAYQADGSVYLTEVVEVTNNGEDGYGITATRTTSRGTAVGQGSSKDGYFVWQLADGTLQAQLSQAEEYLYMAQEEYLDSLFYADYSNVTSAEQNGQLYITADMSYAGEAQLYKEYFWADSTTKEINAMEERYDGPDGEMRNVYLVSYDKPYDMFPECDTLDQVKNAADAADLTLVFVAPEFNYYSSVTYHMSAAVAKNIDTDGYFKIYSSATFAPNSRMDTITMNGNTTLYVLLLSYENAVKAMIDDALAPATPSPTPAPVVTPMPELKITKSPTDETCKVGGQAIFIAKADNATAITWLFAGPDNTIVFAKDAPNYFGCSVYGLGTSTITVANVPASMNGWRIQCKFDGNGGPRWTALATLTVKSEPTPTPTPVPTPTPTPAGDLESEALALAWDNLYDIGSRVQGYGWTVGTMDGFGYDSSIQTAQYDITAYYNGVTVRICCRSYPVQHSYQPSSFWAYYNGAEVYSNSYAGANSSQAWAALINDIALITDSFRPAPEPAPEPTPEPAPEPTPEPVEDLSGEAEALAWDNLYEIRNRTRDVGWEMGTMKNFSYDSSVQCAQYDITATLNDLNIIVSCRSYPVQHSYQPSSVAVFRGGLQIFTSSYAGASSSQAWNAFTDDLGAISNV